MRNWRAGLGVAGAVLPVIYCVVLVWYFADMGGWDNPMLAEQLRPTIIGLSIVGLGFMAFLGFRLRRFLAPPGSPSAPGGGGGSPDDPRPEGDEARHAATDAMIARYLAARDAGAAPSPLHPAMPSEAAPGVTFGRRQRP